MRPAQLAEFLKFSIQHNMPVMVSGAPGTGKTDIVSDVVLNQLGYNLLIGHPVVDEAIDYKGLPFAVNGKAEFLPYGNLRIMLEANEPTVFFFDDFGQADISVQKAIMQLLLSRSINGKKISPHIVFVAATNRQQDKAGVSAILEPVKSRFKSIVELTVNLDDWVNWAIKNNIPSDLVSFIRFRPNLLTDFQPTREIKNSPSPRTIASVADYLKSKLPNQLEYEVFCGAVGEAFTAQFMAFLKLSRKLPNPKSILSNPSTAPVPESPDERYAITGALSYTVASETLPNFITYLDRLPPEFSVLGMKDAIKRIGKDIVMHPAFVAWSNTENNRELLFSEAA